MAAVEGCFADREAAAGQAARMPAPPAQVALLSLARGTLLEGMRSEQALQVAHTYSPAAPCSVH